MEKNDDRETILYKTGYLLTGSKNFDFFVFFSGGGEVKKLKISDAIKRYPAL